MVWLSPLANIELLDVVFHCGLHPGPPELLCEMLQGLIHAHVAEMVMM